MIKKDVLEELSYSLSEKERAELLERINRSLKTGDDEGGSEKKLSEKKRAAAIEGELREMGWLRRILILIISKLSGKKLSDLIVERRMKLIKKKVNRIQPGLTGFESRNLTPLFAENVFTLYSHTLQLRELYRKLWMEPGVYESACMYIISAEYPESRNGLEDFVSMDEMVVIYSETGKKSMIKDEVQNRIDDYLESIPAALFSDIDRGLSPVYRLKDLILFPYTSFFQKFSFTPNYQGDSEKHFFKNASAMLCMDELKLLYRAVLSASALEHDVSLNSHLVEYLLKESDNDNIFYADELSLLMKRIKEFDRNIPMLEIIRFFRNDPYLEIAVTSSDHSFKATYRRILRSIAVDQIDKVYDEVQREYIEREIGKIFSGQEFTEFRNYRKYTSIDYQKMGLPIFNHTKSLNLLYNYIRCFYQSYFSELVSILEKVVLAQNRITRDRLLSHSIAMQELEEKIRLSDKSLSPEEEDGKIFHKLRMSLASEPAQQRMFRSMVVHKNREVKALLDWGEEALGGLERILSELESTSLNNLKVELNKHYLIKGRSTTLISIIKSRRKHLQEFRNLLAHVLKMESA